MSSICNMTIRGIRSFGSDDQDVQRIEFFSPLTLILGPNGTGKTTIIECLKYMTTGDLPPGGKTNAAFIHDPKVAGETTVNAQVTLEFYDVQRTKCRSVRSLTATQKQKKIEMKTQDGLISRKDASGHITSISSRCAEMDREMVSLLGVSKPILESVIFCHQEEANWPLSDGKALKQRFDDIFASTRYVKALDVIKKYRTDQKNEINIMNADVKHLKNNKDIQAEKQAELDEQESRYMASRDAVSAIKEKMQPLMNKLNRLREKGEEIFKLQTRIEKMKTECTQIERTQQELRSNIRQEFQGSMAELQNKLDDFGGQVEQQEDMLRGYERKMEQLTEQLDDISDEKGALLVEQGVLQQEAQRHEQNIKKRDQLIERLAEEYRISGYKAPLSERHISQFSNAMDKKEREMEDELQALRADYEERERAVQVEVDELKKTKTKLETELDMKRDTLMKNRQAIREIKQKLSYVDASADKLTDVQRDLKKTERELAEAEKAVDLDSLRTEVNDLQRSKAKLDADLKTLDKELNQLSLESTARTQLDVYRKEKTTKMDTVRKLKSKTEDSMTHLVGHMPTENLRRELDKSSSKLSQAVRRSREQIRRLGNEYTQKFTQRNMQREQLRSKEEELRGYEEKLNAVAGAGDFDQGLNKIQQELQKAQADKGNLTGIQHLYQKYEDKLQQDDDPPCPLCQRKFDNRTEVDELIQDLHTKINLVPSRLETAERRIATANRRVEEMIQLRPVRSAMAELQGETIPTLKQKIHVLTEQIEKLETSKSHEEEVLETYKVDEDAAQVIQTDVTMIDKYQADLKELDRKIAQQASKLSGGDSGRSMQEVQGEREEIQDELENVNRNLDRKRQKISEQTERRQRLNQTRNELNEEKLAIERDLQQRTQLEERKVQLESSSETLDREVKDGEKEMRPLQSSIAEKEEKKQNISREKEQQHHYGMKEVNAKKENHQRVKSYNMDINNYLTKGNDRRLDENNASMEAAERRAAKFSRDRDTINSKKTDIKDALAEQKIRQRELQDNLSVKQKQREIDERRGQIETLSEQLGGLDANRLAHDQREMEEQLELYNGQKHQAEGRQVGLEDTIRMLKRDLRSDMYRDAATKYRDKMIALRTTQLAYQDLDKYQKALEKAILSYHCGKMKEINKIIRELWRNTYKGNDIDTIEIRTDESGTQGSTRRTYDYRVVMVKGTTDLDMKNRCSAGQKVLASLIIRLALAETFCLNCGILALDEPTTNLDRENIESLAFALVEILKSRHRQKNFQLIVITHDEDFVELLGRSSYVSDFFKVRKNEYGCSQLKKARVQDLHTR